jgi:hypothetical protein
MDLGLVAISAVLAALIITFHLRRRRLTAFSTRIVSNSHSQREATFALASYLFSEVKRARDPPFLTSLLAPIGASPPSVLEHGGCCSGIHRLFITSLDTLGIHSAQLTLYRRVERVAGHCIAQVAVNSEKLIIDVDYGVWLRHPNGNSLSLEELRAGVAPVIEPFVFDKQARAADGSEVRDPGYPPCPYFDFDYRLTRTANWTMSLLRRVVYPVLAVLTRGRVDVFLVPPLFEWPEVLLACALSAAVIVCVAAKAAHALAL